MVDLVHWWGATSIRLMVARVVAGDDLDRGLSGPYYAVALPPYQRAAVHPPAEPGLGVGDDDQRDDHPV